MQLLFNEESVLKLTRVYDFGTICLVKRKGQIKETCPNSALVKRTYLKQCINSNYPLKIVLIFKEPMTTLGIMIQKNMST